MTPTEAFYFAMEKIKELQEYGVKVKMKPSRSRENPDTVAKYNLPDRIPPNLWHHINLIYENEGQYMKIREARSYLGMCGISFDTGGMGTMRDWEFDWSFKYHEGEEKWEWSQRASEVDDMIDSLTSQNNNDCDEEVGSCNC